MCQGSSSNTSKKSVIGRKAEQYWGFSYTELQPCCFYYCSPHCEICMGSAAEHPFSIIGCPLRSFYSTHPLIKSETLASLGTRGLPCFCQFLRTEIPSLGLTKGCLDSVTLTHGFQLALCLWPDTTKLKLNTMVNEYTIKPSTNVSCHCS